MTIRSDLAFYPVTSTEPSFTMNISTVSTYAAIASTTRVWQGPTGRALRFAESSGVEYFIQYGGSSDVVATTTGSMLMLGGVVELNHIPANVTHVALISNATGGQSSVNVTAGYGK